MDAVSRGMGWGRGGLGGAGRMSSNAITKSNYGVLMGRSLIVGCGLGCPTFIVSIRFGIRAIPSLRSS
jgi:hypothetical protein